MTFAATHTPLSGLARRLVSQNLLDEAKASAMQRAATDAKISLVSYLSENKVLPEPQIAYCAALEFGAPLLDLNYFDKELIPSELVAAKLIEKHQAVPLIKKNNRLYIALADPTNLQALDEIKFNTGISTEAIIVEPAKLNKLMDYVLNQSSDASMGDLSDEGLESINISSGESDIAVSAKDAEDAPVIKYVNKIILNAINVGASDIHFEPYEKKCRVRYRIDGVLEEVASPPLNQGPRIAARLKIISQLDISERRVPQDGRFKMKISNNRSIDFRVSTCPTLFGEKVVLRILDPTSATLGIDKLGYEPKQKEMFLKAIAQPQGMVLVTGPTGSGKTVSLYTALNILNRPELNISTAEDPVEINLAGINQVQMNTKAGLDFSAALRSFLRQDPDIIMVGEIRDLVTAEIAIKAAQTGHLVLSTLHTNSAPETLNRLVNMGVPAFNIASAVILIIAQRLARRLCSKCKTPEQVPAETLIAQGFTQEEIPGLKVFGPKGCDECQKGYKGRVGIYEVLPITENVAQVIMKNGNALEIQKAAEQNGFQNLRRSGLNRIADGLTSLEEVNRVTKD